MTPGKLNPNLIQIQRFLLNAATKFYSFSIWLSDSTRQLPSGHAFITRRNTVFCDRDHDCFQRQSEYQQMLSIL